MSGQVSRGSAGEYQADERAGVARLSWRVSGRGAGRCRGAQLASIRQMSGQVSRGSAGDTSWKYWELKIISFPFMKFPNKQNFKMSWTFTHERSAKYIY